MITIKGVFTITMQTDFHTFKYQLAWWFLCFYRYLDKLYASLNKIWTIDICFIVSFVKNHKISWPVKNQFFSIRYHGGIEPKTLKLICEAPLCLINTTNCWLILILSSSCRFPLSTSFSVPLRIPWFCCCDMTYFDVLKRR